MAKGTKHSDLSFNNTEIAFRGKSNQDLKTAYWLFKLLENKMLVAVGASLTRFALQISLPISGIIRRTIYRHFCGGETIDGCENAIQALAQQQVDTILDYSVEGKGSEKDFEDTCAEILRTVKYAMSHDHIPFSVFKLSGLGRFSLLEKINRNVELSRGETEEYQRLKHRIERICAACYEGGVRVLIDAEHSWIQDTIDLIALEMMQKYNQRSPVVYNTYQLYRTDKLASLKADFSIAQTTGFFLGAKLVRGAYLEMERDRADELRYHSPIQPNKAATDRDYDEALCFCLDHINRIGLMAGTHNEASSTLLAAEIDERRIPRNHPHIHFAQLYGMSDNLTFNLAVAGYRVAKYMPYGPVKDVMPYLFRRANENTSVTGQVGRELSLITTEIRRRKAAKHLIHL